MKPLYTKKQFDKAITTDKLPCRCYQCDKVFYKEKKAIVSAMNKRSGHNGKYCSQKCLGNHKNKETLVACKNCNKEFLKKANQIKKSKNNFCCRSCAGTYNSTHKTHGTRRSKLEIYLEEQLTIFYPDLHIDYNKKEAINSELDIYIPSLKLAIELNGIFHYEPIYGDEKLSKIQNNDGRKFQACAEQYISLCIIDTSKQKYFKESTSQEFLNIIINIINNKSKNVLKTIFKE